MDEFGAAFVVILFLVLTLLLAGFIGNSLNRQKFEAYCTKDLTFLIKDVKYECKPVAGPERGFQPQQGFQNPENK